MPNAKFLQEPGFSRAEKVVAVIVGRPDHMHGQGGLSGAECPNMEVMDAGNAGQGFQVGADFLCVDMRGGGVQGQIDGATQQTPSPDQDDRGDQKADGRVDPKPAGDAHDQGCDDDGGRDSGVRCHVQERAPGIEIIV